MPSTRAPRALAGALACVAALTLVWTAAFKTGAGHWIDSATLQGFRDLVRTRSEPLFEFGAHLADPAPFVLAGLVLGAVAFARGRPRSALALLVILAGANATTQWLKPALAEPRFAEWLGRGGQIASASWPSGHATASMSLALGAVLVVPPRLRPVAAVAGAAFAIFVSYCILALGWHYPSDVLGGYLVAATWTSLALAGLWASQVRWPDRTGRAAIGRARSTLVPVGAGLALLAIPAVLVAVSRPGRVADFAAEHTTFVVGAGAIAGLGATLAAVAALALRR